MQPGGVREVAAGQGEDRGRHVLGQHLALEQGALGVELAKPLLLDTVDGGAPGAPALPPGFGAPLWGGLVAFGLAGLFWPPFSSSSVALLQREAPRESMTSVLVANGVVGVLAVPVGTVAGGPLVDLIGAGRTLLLSAVLTLVLGVLAVLALTVRAAWRRPQHVLTDSP